MTRTDEEEDKWEDMDPAVWRYMVMSEIRSLKAAKDGRQILGIPDRFVLWAIIAAVATGNGTQILETMAKALVK